MKVAVLGSGGREHALAWKLGQEIGSENVFVFPGSDAIPNSHKHINPSHFGDLQSHCQELGIELIVPGAEAYLVAGIRDFFKGTGIQVFGPSQQAARLEGSKIEAKNFMRQYGVQTADFACFSDLMQARQYLDQRTEAPCVVKYDGLAAGKGVFVCANHQQAYDSLDQLQHQYGHQTALLIEDCLYGDEISIIGLTDGQNIRLFHPSQDHKQLLDGDQGPNTGGMGVYCPVSFCDEALLATIQEKIIAPTLRGIQAEVLDYVGFIYFGIMLTEQGPFLLEYNARLGDPETEVLLPSLKSPLLPLLQAGLEGRLGDTAMELHEGYFVDVVLASSGYPQQYTKGLAITGLEEVAAEDGLIFHAGTSRDAQGQWRTQGGRVLNVVAQAPTLAAAIERVYQAVAQIHFEGCHYRRDIAQRTSKRTGR